MAARLRALEGAARRSRVLAPSPPKLADRLAMRLGARAVTVSVDAMKQRERLRAGCGFDLSTSGDKVLLRDLGSARPDVAARHAIRQVMEYTRSQNYEAGWKAYQEAAGAPHASLSGAALNLCAKARWWNRAWGVWRGMPEEWRTVVHHTTMIDLCARRKRTGDAEELFSEMVAASVEPNIITHNNLIKAFAMAGMPDRAEKAFRAVPAELLAAGGVRTQRATYQIVMLAWARAGSYAKTRELFMSMCEAAVSPDASHYNALLTACAKSGDGATADGLFSSLLSAGLEPDVTIFTIRLSCHRFNLPRCLEVLEEMRKAALEPTSFTYMELLEAHVLGGDGEGARALLDRPELQAQANSPKLARLAERARGLPAGGAPEKAEGG
uniref:PROP1-like PPR domain-containing protein n=1 Tax=Alexandrium monilatum TaxID=311494 RepID=A0A7S4QFW7_9DINO